MCVGEQQFSIVGMLSVHEGTEVPAPTVHAVGRLRLPVYQHQVCCAFWPEYCMLR